MQWCSRQLLDRFPSVHASYLSGAEISRHPDVGIQVWIPSPTFIKSQICADNFINQSRLSLKIMWWSCLSRSGDTDSVVPVTATRYSIDALNLPTLSKWYPWYDNKKVRLVSQTRAFKHKAASKFVEFHHILMPLFAFVNIGWWMEPNIRWIDSRDNHRSRAWGALASPTTSLHPLQIVPREQGNAYLIILFSNTNNWFVGMKEWNKICFVSIRDSI